jgi:hypothetical protein
MWFLACDCDVAVDFSLVLVAGFDFTIYLLFNGLFEILLLLIRKFES